MQVLWKDSTTWMHSTQSLVHKIVLSICLSCDDMVTRMSIEVQAKGAHLGKMPRANDTLLLYHRYTEHVCLANSCGLPINLLNSHGFYVSFLGIELLGPKWVSSVGGWIKTSCVMSGAYASRLFNNIRYLVLLVPHE